MSEESTTLDLAELARRSVQAASSFEAFVSFLAPDAVFDISPYGMGTYEGTNAIRGFWEGWLDAFDEFAVEATEVLDLGNGVVLSVLVSIGRPRGSSAKVRVPYAIVGVWVDRLLVRFTMYDDIDEPRAVAKRLAEEQG